MASIETLNRILIIDDNEAIHDDFRKILCRESGDTELAELASELFGDDEESSEAELNFELESALQGEAGLKVLEAAVSKERFFGAAFVDMRMPPGWDGVTTIEKLWEVDPDLQVVICTAYSDRSWDEIIERLGRSDKLVVLKKPFDQIEVIQLATSLCEKRRLLLENQQQVRGLQSDVAAKANELRHAHEDSDALLESLTSALVSIDGDGKVARWKAVASEIFEVDKQSAVGVPFRDVPIDWEDREAFLHLIEAATAEQDHATVELVFTSSAGERRTVSATTCPIRNSATECEGATLFLATDVTVQKALQTQLDQALRMESVGQLAAGVAHEINTPMQYIGDNVRYVAKSFEKLDAAFAAIEAIAEPEFDLAKMEQLRTDLVAKLTPKKIKSSRKQIPDALKDSIDGVVAVSKIVSAMKEFSHPGEDSKCLVDLNHILESTITVAKNEWKYVADVETDFEEELPKAEALPSELNQAFLNILVNASHAIGDRVEAGDIEKGLIQVSTHAESDFVLVRIR
ncbi:MAG: PAS domain-containing protein, partial [Planctomycetota bacterium]